jgi:hypothetical protein
MDKPLEPGVRKKGRNTYQVSTEYLKEDFEKMGPEKFKQLMKDKKPKTMKKGGLSAGQKKIAAKAPPPDKIDAKDFAVLKAEKAKGRGMGLQDESVQPGKVQKAFLGKMIKGAGKSIGRLFGAKKSATATPGTVTMSKSGIGGEGGMLPQLLQKAIDDGIIKPASKGRMMKAKRGKFLERRMALAAGKSKAGIAGLGKAFSKTIGVIPLVGKPISSGSTTMGGMSFSDKAKMVDEGKINKATGKFTSMEALRDADKFKKRRMALAAGEKALKASRIGKIALGIGAAGVAASQYLKSKMKKDEPKKKMVGGMAKKYSVGGGMMNKPMGYSSGSKLMDFIKSGSYTDKYGTKTNVDKAIKKINLSPKDKDLATMKPASDKKMMGGGMMQRPMGYKHGTKPGAGPLGAAGLRQPTKENIDQIIKDQKFPPISVYTEDKKKPQKPFPVPSLYNNNKKPSAGRIREDEPRAKKKPSNIFGYKSGTMVKARGCKLGRTRPTKMY